MTDQYAESLRDAEHLLHGQLAERINTGLSTFVVPEFGQFIQDAFGDGHPMHAEIEALRAQIVALWETTADVIIDLEFRMQASDELNDLLDDDGD